VALPPRRWRPYGVFLAQMWAYLRAFELTYEQPERLRRRLVIDAPIAVDRVLGAGRTPTERLQVLRAKSRRRAGADRLLGGLYFAWALERHAVLTWILCRHRGHFPRAAALVGATFDVSWVIFSAFPTTPPWWAGKAERLPRVRRITVDASKSLPLVPEQNERDDDQGNPWASTPSQHAASAAMVALVAAERDGRVGAAAWSYAAILGLALVYLGEHYLVDVLTGVLLALAVHRAERLVSRPAGRLADAIDDLHALAWDVRPRRRVRRLRSRKNCGKGAR